MIKLFGRDLASKQYHCQIQMYRYREWMKWSALIKNVLIFEQYNKYHMENIEENKHVDIKAEAGKGN